MASISNYRPKGSIWIETNAGVSTVSNVGIGTTNPTAKLRVDGDALITGILTAKSVVAGVFYGSGIGLTGIVANLSESAISGLNVSIDGDDETSYYLKINQNTPGITTAFYNFIVGVGAGKNLIIGNSNNLFGKNSGYNNVAGDYNNFLGQETGYNNTTGSDNIFIGKSCGYNNTIGSRLVFLGNESGFNNITGNDNVYIGNKSAFSIVKGSNNIFIGNSSGSQQLGGDGNVIIGSVFGCADLNKSNQLAIGSSIGTWIYGNDSFNVGIGITNPSSKLTVGGDLKVGINTLQGLILTAQNGNRYRLIVGNNGELITVPV